MSKPRSKTTDFAVYLLIRFIVCLIQLLSYETAKKLARGLAWFLHFLDKRHRQVADENLRHAYGDAMTPAQRNALVRSTYTHFCTLLIELVHLTRRLHASNWKRYAELVGGKGILEALLSDRPVLIVTGHYGNWEIAGYALGLFGFHTYAIARTLDNPYLEDYLRAFRERTGQRILAKKGDFDQIQQVLASGGVLATLGDQDAGERGLYVNFFGRPASTHKAVALLAMEYNVKMLVIGVPRLANVQVGDQWMDSPERYRVILADCIDPEEYRGRTDAVKAITQRYTAALEKVIRIAPEQYFWLHRRWKHQPQPRKGKKAA